MKTLKPDQSKSASAVADITLDNPSADTVPSLSFDLKLERLAEVAIKVGLGLKQGQELVMTASLEPLPLARKITEHAYKAGASLVTTLLTDEEATLLRFRHGSDESFDHAPVWLQEGVA